MVTAFADPLALFEPGEGTVGVVGDRAVAVVDNRAAKAGVVERLDAQRVTIGIYIIGQQIHVDRLAVIGSSPIIGGYWRCVVICAIDGDGDRLGGPVCRIHREDVIYDLPADQCIGVGIAVVQREGPKTACVDVERSVDACGGLRGEERERIDVRCGKHAGDHRDHRAFGHRAGRLAGNDGWVVGAVDLHPHFACGGPATPVADGL